MRLWSRLGFGQAQAPIVPERAGEQAIYVVTVAMLSWRDRLRVLVSGRFMFVAACYVSGDVEVVATYPAVSVLPPTWAAEPPAIRDVGAA